MATEATDAVLLGLSHSEIIAIGAIVVTVLGWFVLSHKNRKLQRKQLTIQLLHENRFIDSFQESISTIFEIFRHDKNYDWGEMFDTYVDKTKKLSDDHDRVFKHLMKIANYYEFISIAMKNKAIDENIVKWSFEYHFITLYTECEDFFLKAAALEDGVFCNYLALVDKWKTPKSEKLNKFLAKPD